MKRRTRGRLVSARLGDLLTDEQAVQVGVLVAKKDRAALRAYLNSMSAQLGAKGVVADYLYYYLLHLFDQN